MRQAGHLPGRDREVDTIEHCSFAGSDRRYGSDFDPAAADEIAAAGIYVCPTMNVHALTMRDRFGDALEKVIMGLYSGGVQIIAGTDAGIDNCPHDAYVRGLEALAMVGMPAAAGPPPGAAPGGFAPQPGVLASPSGPRPR